MKDEEAEKSNEPERDDDGHCNCDQVERPALANDKQSAEEIYDTELDESILNQHHDLEGELNLPVYEHFHVFERQKKVRLRTTYLLNSHDCRFEICLQFSRRERGRWRSWVTHNANFCTYKHDWHYKGGI